MEYYKKSMFCVKFLFFIVVILAIYMSFMNDKVMSIMNKGKEQQELEKILMQKISDNKNVQAEETVNDSQQTNQMQNMQVSEQNTDYSQSYMQNMQEMQNYNQNTIRNVGGEEYIKEQVQHNNDTQIQPSPQQYPPQPDELQNYNTSNNQEGIQANEAALHPQNQIEQNSAQMIPMQQKNNDVQQNVIPQEQFEHIPQ